MIGVSQRIPLDANSLSAPSTPERRVPMIDRDKVDPEIREAAEGMESMFIDYMLKTMRETVPENAMGLDSPATKIYTGMMDSEIAQRVAKAGGMGLADPLIAYLQAQRYNGIGEHGAPEGRKSTGGTDESRPIRK